MQASGELGAPLFLSLTSSSLIFYFANICVFKLEVCRSDIEDHVPQGSQNILDNMVVQCFFEVYIGTMLKKDMIGSEDCQSSRHIPVCYQILKKEKQLYSIFLENLPVEYLDRDKYEIKDIFDGFSRKTWRIFFVGSLLALLFSYFPFFKTISS
ncbi:hypothetical protein VPH35_044652 [Triticum aestivum]